MKERSKEELLEIIQKWYTSTAQSAGNAYCHKNGTILLGFDSICGNNMGIMFFPTAKEAYEYLYTSRFDLHYDAYGLLVTTSCTASDITDAILKFAKQKYLNVAVDFPLYPNYARFYQLVNKKPTIPHSYWDPPKYPQGEVLPPAPPVEPLMKLYPCLNFYENVIWGPNDKRLSRRGQYYALPGVSAYVIEDYIFANEKLTCIWLKYKNKWGLFEGDHFVISPIFEEVIKIKDTPHAASEEGAECVKIVKKNGKYGLVDEAHLFIYIDTIYELITYLHGPYFIAKKNSKYGLITGRKSVLDCEYDGIEYINKNESITYDRFLAFFDILILRKDGKYGVYEFRFRSQANHVSCTFLSKKEALLSLVPYPNNK